MDECIEPGKIEDWQLDAFADGHHDPAVEAHLTLCASCRQKVAQYSVFRGVLHRFSCPSPEDLNNFISNLPTEMNSRDIRRHLAKCPECIREYGVIHTAAPRSDPVPLVDRLNQFLESATIFVAKLIEGPMVLNPVRSDAEMISIRYRIEPHDWELMIEPTILSDKTYALTAFLEGPEDEELEAMMVALNEDDELLLVKQVSEFGEISFTELLSGHYSLRFFSAEQLLFDVVGIELA